MAHYYFILKIKKKHVTALCIVDQAVDLFIHNFIYFKFYLCT